MLSNIWFVENVIDHIRREVEIALFVGMGKSLCVCVAGGYAALVPLSTLSGSVVVFSPQD